jgi:hypothetical protein
MNRRLAERGTNRFRGIERDTARLDSSAGFETDQNGRHKVRNEWQLRKGLSRAPSIVSSGEEVYRLHEFVAQGNNRMVVAFRGNGQLIAAPTPDEAWTS